MMWYGLLISVYGVVVGIGKGLRFKGLSFVLRVFVLL